MTPVAHEVLVLATVMVDASDGDDADGGDGTGGDASGNTSAREGAKLPQWR